VLFFFFFGAASAVMLKSYVCLASRSRIGSLSYERRVALQFRGERRERGGKKADNCAYVTYRRPRVISCVFTTAETTRI